VRPLSRSGKNSSTPNTRIPSEKLVPYMFYGPTCDNLDKMKGPFMLPEDTQEGDWIEIGMLGAYGSAMQTHFNGFHSQAAATVWPEAIPTLAAERTRRRPEGVQVQSNGEFAQVPLTLRAPEPRSEHQSESQELPKDGNADPGTLELK
jgi:hypothetical protein